MKLQIIQCDRCGQQKLPGYDIPVMQELIVTNPQDASNRMPSYDLCEGCTASVRHFMSLGKGQDEPSMD